MMKWTTLVTDCQELLHDETSDWNGRERLHLSDALGKLLRHELSCREILILTDKQETLKLAEQIQVPCVGLEPEEASGHLTGTPYILQAAGAECTAFLEKIYERYYKQPVVVLETEHLCLREMIESDTDNLHRLYHCQDVRGVVSEAGLSREELAEFVKSYRSIRYPMYDYGMWIIEEKETGCFVGEAGMEEDSKDRTGQDAHGIWLEAGYAVCPEFRGRGYAAEALEAIVKFARFEKECYGFERICCYIRPENIPSVRTAERCGFLKSMDGVRYGEEQELVQYRICL